MEKRQLEIHQFTIRNKNDKEKANVPLFNIEGDDLLNVIYNKFVGYVKGIGKGELESKSVVRFKKDNNNKPQLYLLPTKRILFGKINTGYFGKIDDVFNIDNDNDEPDYVIKENQSVQKPFYFMICIPNLKDTGYIILEREGTSGIKQIFSWLFEKFVRETLHDYRVDITHFIEENIIKRYITDGQYSSITLTRNSLPADVAERYGLERYDTNDYTIELKITAKNGKKIGVLAKHRILSIFKGDRIGYFTDTLFPKIGFDKNSTIKIKSNFNNAVRTVNLDDTMKFKPYYDIDVELDERNYSELNSIHSEAVKLIESLGLELYNYEIKKQVENQLN